MQRHIMKNNANIVALQFGENCLAIKLRREEHIIIRITRVMSQPISIDMVIHTFWNGFNRTGRVIPKKKNAAAIIRK